MANNRLFLHCNRCNDAVTIARLQVGMEHEWLPSRTTLDNYEVWLLKHSNCGDGLNVKLTSENDTGLYRYPHTGPSALGMPTSTAGWRVE